MTLMYCDPDNLLYYLYSELKGLWVELPSNDFDLSILEKLLV
jgi:hypothetical protein